MLLHVPEVLSRDMVEKCREILLAAQWVDGKVTAGTQSEQVKNNRQLPEDSEAAKIVRTLLVDQLSKSALFFTAALPRKIYPPLFNRYEGTANSFGNHVDNAVRTHAASSTHVRTDLSATLFFSDPNEYEGGELVVEDTFGHHKIKLPAGDMILYPSSSVHRVEPVTRGARIAAFFWIESMVRDIEQRRLLFDMDMAIMALRQASGDTAETVKLTSCYHNLVRMWAST